MNMLTVPQKPVDNLYTYMLTFPMLARQITFLAVPLALIPLLPITSLQSLRFHAITHSFAQRQPVNAFSIKGLRTLSIVTGVVPPSDATPIAVPLRRVWRPLDVFGASIYHPASILLLALSGPCLFPSHLTLLREQSIAALRNAQITRSSFGWRLALEHLDTSL
jgi:hypothetical protein